MNQKKILIVDDNAVILRALSMKLQAEQYLPLTAEDASEALAVVRREKPDLIVLDLGFPPDAGHGGMMSWDGFTIMEWIRRSEQGKDTPFFILTGDTSDKAKKRALASGVVRFFHKPVDNDELVAAIKECLEQPPGAAKPPA